MASFSSSAFSTEAFSANAFSFDAVVTAVTEPPPFGPTVIPGRLTKQHEGGISRYLPSREEQRLREKEELEEMVEMFLLWKSRQ